MEIKLLQASDYETLMHAIRTSHDSKQFQDTYLNELGLNDRKLLEKIIQLQHDSVLEHLVYSFYIAGISRALLQQLARHRHISMTVQSTRYTLRKQIKAAFASFSEPKTIVTFLCVLPPDLLTDENTIRLLYETFSAIQNSSEPNDTIKCILPECLKTQVVLTVNARELAHIINLRSSKHAYWEFQRLSKNLFNMVFKIHPQLWQMLAERYDWRWFDAR